MNIILVITTTKKNDQLPENKYQEIVFNNRYDEGLVYKRRIFIYHKTHKYMNIITTIICNDKTRSVQIV